MSQNNEQPKPEVRKASPEELAARREADDMRKILATEEGKRLFWRYLGITGVFQTSFIPESPESTFFNEGKRSVGTTMLNDIMKHAPQAFVQMLDNDLKGRN